MDSRFAHLYKRDSSVSMLRVKMSRRRSQTQKENREKMQNLRRHLDQLPEMEHSLDVSNLDKSALPSPEKGLQPKADNGKTGFSSTIIVMVCVIANNTVYCITKVTVL